MSLGYTRFMRAAMIHEEILEDRRRKGLDKRDEVWAILSPGDESREKLPFYAKVGVREVWLVDPDTREVEVFMLRDGRLATVRARDGVVRSPMLGLELAMIWGMLCIDDGERVVEL